MAADNAGRRLAIEARGLVKRFDGTLAVDGVELAVPEGTIYGVLGPNGAGKTTTLRMLLGIIDPDEGERRVLGHANPQDVAKAIGYLPEERGLYPTMKAYEAIAFMGALRGLPLTEGRRRGRELLEAHGLPVERQIRQLSKGMAQQVQLLGTLVHEPRLVILDEPFSGLDAINQGKLEALIRSLAEKGTTVIFSTHVIAHAERLPLLKAAYVIARRDFTAILFSRAFIFFLLGPLFPLTVGAIAGGIGQRAESAVIAPQVGLAMETADVDRMLGARAALAPRMGPGLPEMVVLERLAPGEKFDASGVLERREGNIGGVLTGTPAAPELTVTEERQWWAGPVALVAAAANRSAPTVYPEVRTTTVAASGASETRARMRTAQAGQVILFLLTMLLAGMVLSNLVEEKANKIIEILAAAIPMDAVFLGKLFAMLAVSLVGIAVWTAAIGGAMGLPGLERLFGGAIDLSGLPVPGVGWPLFLLLALAYFAMGYLLLGSVFLAIGSLATTVREVQTLSMPVTMLQVFLFLFATLAVAERGGWLEWSAMAFPFSSPYTMLARAAQDEAVWPHAAALLWQLLWVALSIRLGAALFRKRVMKSGPQRAKARRAVARGDART